MQRIADLATTRRTLLGGASVAAAGALLTRGPIAPAAAAAACEARYPGYRAADYAQPYAKYWKEHTDPPQARIPAAIAAGPVDPSLIPTRSQLPADIQNPGYSRVETGYGRLRTGEIWVAALTDMPRVQPEMWDWWFGWHSKESARYKLWHPDAHQYAALKYDRASSTTLTDRQKYIDNVSYVDEIIGGHLDELAINFQAPSRYGIDTSKFDGTVIIGTVGTALLPVNIGVLCHQVRRTKTGSEMRSRFYLNVAGVRSTDANAIACAIKRGIALPAGITFDLTFGAALLLHCGQEMNHLAQFLPELYAEFS